MSIIASDSMDLTSIKDVTDAANEAQAQAEATNQHFWHDASGAHITEVTQEEYEQDPTTAGGNTLITSNGMDIRNGTDTLASFRGSGVFLGVEDDAQAILTSESFTLTDDSNIAFFDVSDLRTDNGYATLTYEEISNGSTNTIPPISASSITSITVNGVAATYSFLPQMNSATITSPTVLKGDVIKVVFRTTDVRAKRFLFGYNPDDSENKYPFIVSGHGGESNSFAVTWAGDLEASGTITNDGDIIASGTVQDAHGVIPQWARTSIVSGSTNFNGYQSRNIALTEVVDNFAFIEMRLYNGSADASTILLPTPTLKWTVNDVQTTNRHLLRIGTTNYYVGMRWVSDTSVNVSFSATVSTALYVTIGGYGRIAGF